MTESHNHDEFKDKNYENIVLRPLDIKEKPEKINIDDDDIYNQQMLAYYAKALQIKQRSALDARFIERARVLEAEPTETNFYPLKHLSQKERRAVFANLGAFQLTYGCNSACSFCSSDAVAGARESIPYTLIAKLAETYKKELLISQPFLYYASDPLDYRSPQAEGSSFDYSDIEQLFRSHIGYRPYISTTIPKGSESVARKIYIDRLSIADNKRYLEKRGLIGTDKNTELKIGEMYNVKKTKSGLAQNLSHQNQDLKIGSQSCFNGALLTPRGCYSVVTLQRTIDTANAPQGELVAPYIKESTEYPESGDDMLRTLQHHLPMLMKFEHRYTFNESAFLSLTYNGDEVVISHNPSVEFYIARDTKKDEDAEKYILIFFKDNKVIMTEPVDEFIKRTSDLARDTETQHKLEMTDNMAAIKYLQRQLVILSNVSSLRHKLQRQIDGYKNLLRNGKQYMLPAVHSYVRYLLDRKKIQITP